jgi:Pyruvate/2-oxoacid:ferredoxin oxidoreductase delta subunit
MARRNIVYIDPTRCDGCGQCISSCAEGAIQLVDGKARLVSDIYCDGLGACLGHCPQDAITIVDRDSEDFDERAAREHLARLEARRSKPAECACPGSLPQSLGLPLVSPPASAGGTGALGAAPSGLVHWPIQLHLVPPGAAFLRQADVVLAADCVAFAYAGLHGEIVRGRPLLIGCPKLDDAAVYVEKLAGILSIAQIRSLSIVRMEVPCCAGLLRIAAAAQQRAGRAVPIEEVVISIRGQRIGPGR